MKLYAQHGYGPSDKLSRGLDENLIDGVIFSPRYATPEKMAEKIGTLNISAKDILIDPEFYATRHAGSPNASIGSLEEWGHFNSPRRAGLISGVAIQPAISAALEVQRQFPVSSFISPNIYINNFDSIDAAIALNFINASKQVATSIDSGKDVLASLVIDRDALLRTEDFREFLNAMTSLQNPPDGFYVVVGGGAIDERSSRSRAEIYHADVIAGWMLVNYTLSINGFNVVNGYSDLLSPLLGISGGEAGATGWFSNLQQFSLGRYIRSARSGGRSPLPRYVSNVLLARIKHTDFLNYCAVEPAIPNDLASDGYYLQEPSRTEEALQCWDALSALSNQSITQDVEADLHGYLNRVRDADRLWSRLAEQGFSQEFEANRECLEAIVEGIRMFRRWAELD